MVRVTDGVTSMRKLRMTRGQATVTGTNGHLALPEGNSPQGLDFQLLLQDLTYLALLRSLLHLLSPDHIHTSRCQDQVPLDGL